MSTTSVDNSNIALQKQLKQQPQQDQSRITQAELLRRKEAASNKAPETKFPGRVGEVVFNYVSDEDARQLGVVLAHDTATVQL